MTMGCLVLLSGEVLGQYPVVPVTISTEKVRMGGKVYYSHVVLEKQTLYSISKAYGVDIQDIYAANPTLKEEGLKKNAVILIPAAQPAEGVAKTNAAEEQDQSAAKDTKEKRSKKKKARKDDGFLTHTVKWYEDLDVISEKYGVPVDIIMQVNGLKGRKLSNRQKLLIPTDTGKYMADNTETSSQQQEETESAPAPQQPAKTDVVKETTTAAEPAARKSYVSAALMLPLYASDGQGSKNNMDFYSGVLLAAKDLGDEGISVDLSTYDVGNSIPVTSSRLAASDVIIGPVSASDMEEVMSLSPESHFISPLDPRVERLLPDHRNLIQAPTPASSQYSDLVNWIKEEKSPADKVLSIFEKGMRESGYASVVESSIGKSGMTCPSFSYSILEGRDVLEQLETMMDSVSVNRVIVVSESEAFVNDVVRNLNLMVHDGYKIVLYGPSRLRGFETIDVDDYYNVNLHLSMSYYVDYENQAVKDFIMKYRALYNTEPSAFAFQGYDIMKYFVRKCAEYGDGWAERLETAGTEKTLQSDFRFMRKGEGGLENTGIRRIIYGPGYSMRMVE